VSARLAFVVAQLGRADAGGGAEEPDKGAGDGVGELVGQAVAGGAGEEEVVAHFGGEGIDFGDSGGQGGVVAEEGSLPGLGERLGNFEERGIFGATEFLGQSGGLHCSLEFELPELREGEEDLGVLRFAGRHVAGEHVAAKGPERVRKRFDVLALAAKHAAETGAR
jgi:hypothetical protein